MTALDGNIDFILGVGLDNFQELRYDFQHSDAQDAYPGANTTDNTAIPEMFGDIDIEFALNSMGDSRLGGESAQIGFTYDPEPVNGNNHVLLGSSAQTSQPGTQAFPIDLTADQGKEAGGSSNGTNLGAESNSRTPVSLGTKRKVPPTSRHDLDRQRPPKSCRPGSCQLCKERKSRCSARGGDSCEQCLRAGKPCVREAKDKRTKGCTEEEVCRQDREYFDAYQAACELAFLAGELEASKSDLDINVDSIVDRLSEARNNDLVNLMQDMPVIAHRTIRFQELGLPMVYYDRHDARPVERTSEHFSKPGMKRYLDKFVPAAQSNIDNFRKALLALFTPVADWPDVLEQVRQNLFEWVRKRRYQKLVDWAAQTAWTQQLLQHRQAV